jgi:hypothetical protein
MTAGPSPIAAEAQALKGRYGALLSRQAPPDDPGRAEAVAALDAAQQRLCGGERPEDGQLTLDLRGAR